MKTMRIISGVLVFIAVIFTWLSVFTLFNRLYIFFNRNQYQVESFEVTGAGNISSRKGFNPYWLGGTVAGKPEYVKPELPPGFKPTSPADLLTLFPPGSVIPVLYNPNAPEAMIQGEKLRVFHYTPDFWVEESYRLIKFLCFFLLPVPLTFALYRFISKRV